MSEREDDLDPRVDAALASLARTPCEEPDVEAALVRIRARLVREDQAEPLGSAGSHRRWKGAAAALALAAGLVVWIVVRSAPDREEARHGSPSLAVAESAAEPVTREPNVAEEEPPAIDLATELCAAMDVAQGPSDAKALEELALALENRLDVSRFEILGDVRRMLEDPDVDLAQAALRYLVARGDRAHVPSIAAASHRAELSDLALAGLTQMGASGWREVERALDDDRGSRALEVLRDSSDERALRILHDCLSGLDVRAEPERVRALVHTLLHKGPEGAERLLGPRLLRGDMLDAIESAVGTASSPQSVEALVELSLDRELGRAAVRSLGGIASRESFAALFELYRTSRGPRESVEAALARAVDTDREAWSELALELEGEPLLAAELLDLLLAIPGQATDRALIHLLALDGIPQAVRLLAVDQLRELGDDSAMAEAFLGMGALAPSDTKIAAALCDGAAERFGSTPILDAIDARGIRRKRLEALFEDGTVSHASRIVRIARELGRIPRVSSIDTPSDS